MEKKQSENTNFLSFQDGGYGKHGWLEDYEISEFPLSKYPPIKKNTYSFPRTCLYINWNS